MQVTASFPEGGWDGDKEEWYAWMWKFTLVNGALEPVLLRIREQERTMGTWYEFLV